MVETFYLDPTKSRSGKLEFHGFVTDITNHPEHTCRSSKLCISRLKPPKKKTFDLSSFSINASLIYRTDSRIQIGIQISAGSDTACSVINPLVSIGRLMCVK